jgi:hypothetical protein
MDTYENLGDSTGVARTLMGINPTSGPTQSPMICKPEYTRNGVEWHAQVGEPIGTIPGLLPRLIHRVLTHFLLFSLFVIFILGLV